MSQDRQVHLTISLGEALTDIEDVCLLSEAELEQLGSEATDLINQIEDLASQLAMLAEDKYHNTRYCDIV
jgi:cell division protein FtsB